MLAAFSISDLRLDSETLGVALGFYLALIIVGKVFKQRTGVRLGVIYQLFCLTLSPYLATAILEPGAPLRRELGAAAVLLAAAALIRPIDHLVWRQYFEVTRRSPVPKFIREVSAGLLMAVALMLVITFGYDMSVPGLLAGSSVIGIILGFAMQDTLGNVIAGLALQFARPFEVGDWLLIEGRHAEAIEINWRSSRFRTNDRVQLDMPNLMVVRAMITNYHGGAKNIHAMRLEIGIDSDVAPNRVKELLSRAAANADHVIADPAPNVFLKQFADSAVLYEVRFWLDNHRFYNIAMDNVQTNIWYALRRAHIKVPFPIRTLQIERQPTSTESRDRLHEERRLAAKTLLRSQPVFRGIGDEQFETLMLRAIHHQYGRGEPIIREGSEGSSMFVLVRGEAGVTVGAAGGAIQTRVATLMRGDCFGEMSLLTGERRSASVVAASDCEVIEITKPIFGEIVARDPDLLPRLSELLASRQLETEGILQAQASGPLPTVDDAKEREYRAGFLKKLRSFFEL